MNPQIIRLAGSLVVPLGILGSVAWAVPTLASIPRAYAALIPHLPYMTLGLGLVLSWRFRNSRSFFALAGLLVTYVSLRYGLPHGLDRGVRAQAIYNFTGVVAPIVFTAICVLEERGIFTLPALSRFTLLLVPAATAAFIINWPARELVSLLPPELLQPGRLSWTPLPTFAIATFAVGSTVLLARLALCRVALEGLILASMLGVALALHMDVQPISTAVLVTVAGLLLIFGVIQDGYRKAYVDELTGLPGRRALDEELQKLSGNFAVAMVDVDHFKRLNDTYGHDVGDQVLRMIASQLERVSGGGRPFRYGGEEFSILFYGRAAESVVEHLEDMRERIASTPFNIRRGRRGKSPNVRIARHGGARRRTVTISIGVAEPSARLNHPKDVLKAADRALYRAKRSGRNRVCD
ncbi:MAG: diguanylate cyclase [Acidiferrobacterales bacterium]